MEVGAVKQAFNNEIILLKKSLNQAKIQTIHKLTRKAKMFTEKKVPETHREKIKRKAEAAVREVLIIKKIKARDIARFIVTHTGKLNDSLNKPIVDNDKAYARLLLHKALQEKYKLIRDKFSNTSIKDLFMSRHERRKLKKEAKEKQTNKKKLKEKSNIVNVEGDWNVEITESIKEKEETAFDDNSDLNDDNVIDNDSVNDGSETENNKLSSDESNSDLSYDEINIKANNGFVKLKDNVTKGSISGTIKNLITYEDSTNNMEINNKLNNKNNLIQNKSIVKQKKKVSNKNKNLKEKLEKRKFNKECNETPSNLSKIVDPFFITSTGETYISLVEPRKPDEVKDFHKEGNRQYRRAVMFGNVPKIKAKKHFESRSNNGIDMSNKKLKSNDRHQYIDKNNKMDKRKIEQGSVPEKLHPSWEAKKKQSGILPFKGKKIVFNDG